MTYFCKYLCFILVDNLINIITENICKSCVGQLYSRDGLRWQALRTGSPTFEKAKAAMPKGGSIEIIENESGKKTYVVKNKDGTTVKMIMYFQFCINSEVSFQSPADVANLNLKFHSKRALFRDPFVCARFQPVRLPHDTCAFP